MFTTKVRLVFLLTDLTQYYPFLSLFASAVQGLFEFLYALPGLHDTLTTEFSFPDKTQAHGMSPLGNQGIILQVIAEEKNVGSRLYAHQNDLFERIIGMDGIHLQVVGDDNTLPAQFPARQARFAGGRETAVPVCLNAFSFLKA